MKSKTKTCSGARSCAVWLALSSCFIALPMQQAEAVGLFQEGDLQSVTFYEMTSGTKTLAIPSANFPTVLSRLPALNSGNYDLVGSSAGEYYDLYTSNPVGQYAADGNFLTIDVRFDIYDIAGNVDAVKLVWGGSAPGTDYATKITRVVHGGPPGLPQTTWTNRALGAPDGSATGLGATRQGVGNEYVELMSLTLAFPDSFFSGLANLTAAVNSSSPIDFMSGSVGGGRLTSLGVTAPGDFSFNPSVVDGTAFGFSGLPPAPPDASLYSNIPRQLWEIGFTGKFNGVAGLEFTYDETWIPAGFSESNLAVYHYSGSAWETLAGVINPGNNTISFNTGSFSPFVLGVVPEPTTLWLGLPGLMVLAARRRRNGSRGRAS